MRNTFAPNPARKRVAIGPARTRASGPALECRPVDGRLELPVRSGAPGVGHGETRERFGRERDALGCVCHSSKRISAAQPPASTIAASSAVFVQRLTAADIAARSACCRAPVPPPHDGAARSCAGGSSRRWTRSLRRSDPTVRAATIHRPNRQPKPERCKATIDAKRGNAPLHKVTSSAMASDAAATDALARSVTRNTEGRSPSPSKRNDSSRARSPPSSFQIDAVKLADCSVMP